MVLLGCGHDEADACAAEASCATDGLVEVLDFHSGSHADFLEDELSDAVAFSHWRLAWSARQE